MAILNHRPSGSKRQHPAYPTVPDTGMASSINVLALKGDIDLIVRSHDLAPLSLRCHKTLLRLASPLLDDLLESCSGSSEAAFAPETLHNQGSGRFPSLHVDGSIQAWTAILANLYSGFSPPSTASLPLSSEAYSDAKIPPTQDLPGAVFTWTSAREMLPVLHK